jgi:hypothetical protein
MAGQQWKACRGARALVLDFRVRRRRTLTNNVDSPRAHWFGDVLERLRPKVVAGQVYLAPDLPIGVVRNANTTRLRNAFKARCDVDAIAQDIIVVMMMSPTWMPIRNSIR